MKSRSIAKIVIFNVYLCLFLSSPAFAVNEDLKKSNLEVFDRVSEILRERLGQSESSAYQKAFELWQAKESELRAKITDDTQALEKLIANEFRQLGLSHMGFLKDRPQKLGMKTVSLGDGKEKVLEVKPGSAAEKAGLQKNDIILEINDRPATNAIQQSYYDKEFLTFKIEDRSPTLAKIGSTDLLFGKVPSSHKRFGMMGVDSELREDGSLIVFQVFNHSPAAEAGLKAGDRILTIGKKTAAEALRAGLKPQKEVTLQVMRKNGEEEKLQMTPVSRENFNRPSFHEVDTPSGKAVYLKIPCFAECYDPKIVSEAMELAKTHQSLIVDLSDNAGGRSDHLLSYFLSAQTPLWIEKRGDEVRQDLKNSLPNPGAGRVGNWKVEKGAFPYQGNVAFVVNENTYCAAEHCALVPLEYQELRKHGRMNGQKYGGEFYPKNVRVFGNTKGAFQIAGSESFKTQLGRFTVSFPRGELVTPIYQNSIEGKGIREPICADRSKTSSPSTDTQIERAIYWMDQIERKTMDVPSQYTQDKTKINLVKEAAERTLKRIYHGAPDALVQEKLAYYLPLIERFSDPKSRKSYFSGNAYQELYDFLIYQVRASENPAQHNTTHSLAHPQAEPEYLMALDFNSSISEILGNARAAKEYSRKH